MKIQYSIFVLFLAVGSFLLGDYCDIWFKAKTTAVTKSVPIAVDIKIPDIVRTEKIEGTITKTEFRKQHYSEPKESSDSVSDMKDYKVELKSDNFTGYISVRALDLKSLTLDSMRTKVPDFAYVDTVTTTIECPKYEPTWVEYSILVVAVYGIIRLTEDLLLGKG